MWSLQAARIPKIRPPQSSLRGVEEQGGQEFSGGFVVVVAEVYEE